MDQIHNNHIQGKISKNISSYLLSLRENNKNEVYETLLLMMLNDDFKNAIENLVEKNIKNIKVNKGMVKIEMKVTSDYIKTIQFVCKSKYFKENFTKLEIKKKENIALNLVPELTLHSFLTRNTNFKSVLNINIKDAVNPSLGYKEPLNKSSNLPLVNSHSVIFPLINHKEIGKNKDQIQLSFYKDEQLDEIIKYLKVVLGIKNKTKKKKLSLGQSFRMLQIENEIKNNPEQYQKQKNEYPEQIISREMKSRYKETASMEKVFKSLQRIKKIKKEINSKDK
jgi:hypothetical protein